MDMTSQQMDNSILEAFSILTDSALENAEFDKTIRAAIYSCQDESLGYYKVQHQDSILNAYAIDPSVRYSKGTAVIVHVPKGDSTAKKTILGSVSQLGTEYVQDLIEGTEIFDVSGNLLENIKTGVFPIGLKKLESEIDITNYFSKSENLLGYLKNSTHFKLTLLVKTNIPPIYRKNGEYGIRIETKIRDNATNEEKPYTFVFRNFDFVGSLYSYNQWSEQNIIKDIDGIEITSIEKIYAYSTNFYNNEINTEEEETETPYILFDKISLNGGLLLQRSEKNGVSLSFLAQKGYFFGEKSNEKETRPIQVVIKRRMNTVDPKLQGLNIYWFKQDMSVIPTSDNYLSEGGIGWACINKRIQNKTRQSSFITSDKVVITKDMLPLQKETTFKCVVEYNDKRYEKNFVIIDESKNYVLTVQSSAGTHFERSMGSPTLTCLIKKDNIIEPIDNYRFSWYVNNNQNQTQFLNLEYELKYDQAYCENKIANLERAWNQGQIEKTSLITNKNIYKDYFDSFFMKENESISYQILLQRYKEAKKNLLNKQYVYKNILYHIDLTKVVEESTFVCQIYTTTIPEKLVGTAFLKLKNKNALTNGYELIINNGNQTFLYDQNGVSLYGDSLENPYPVQELSFSLYKNGNKIEYSKIGFADILWKIPCNKNNTLIQYNAGQGDTKKGDYYYVKQKQTISFKVNRKYDVNKSNNDIILSINYKDNQKGTFNISASTTFSFTKQGGNGTNGTIYQFKVIEANNNLQQPSFSFYKKMPKNNTSNVNPQERFFKAQIWRGGEEIKENEEKIKQFGLKILKSPTNKKTSISLNQKNLDKISQFSVTPITPAWWLLEVDKRPKEQKIIDIINYNNIIQVEGTPTQTNKKHYFTLSIPTIYYNNFYINKNDKQITIDIDYTVKIRKGSGFREVLYNKEGVLPSYDERLPFEVNIYNKDGDEITNRKKDNSFIFTFNWGRVTNNITIKSTSRNTCICLPSPTYNNKNCTYNAVYVKITNNINGSEIIVHIPIHFMVNRYSNPALNDWDGTSIEIKNEKGYILSPQIGAGSKNTKNEFTGITMGAEQDSNSKIKTGLFGYSSGERSIFLDAETGNATFGTSGEAQIKITATGDSTIQSGDYPYKKTTDTSLKKGKIYYKWDDKNEKYVEVKNPNLNELKNGNYYEKGGGMKIKFSSTGSDTEQGPYIKFGSGYFSVSSDGSIHAKGKGDIAGWIIDNNKIYKGTTGMSSQITTVKDIDPSKSRPQQNSTVAFYAGQTKQTGDTANSPNFYVTHAGYLFSKSGQIAGWNISADKLGKGNVEMNSNPGTGTNKAFKCGDDFYVRHDGYLFSQSGKIGDWDITDKSLKSGKVGMAPYKTTDTQYAFWVAKKDKINGTSTENNYNFFVKHNGYLKSTYGQIGHWLIGDGGLYASPDPDFYTDLNGQTNKIEIKTYTMSIKNSQKKVESLRTELKTLRNKQQDYENHKGKKDSKNYPDLTTKEKNRLKDLPSLIEDEQKKITDLNQVKTQKTIQESLKPQMSKQTKYTYKNTRDGVYFGVDGIRFGKYFHVDSSGMFVTQGKIGGVTIYNGGISAGTNKNKNWYIDEAGNASFSGVEINGAKITNTELSGTSSGSGVSGTGMRMGNGSVPSYVEPKNVYTGDTGQTLDAYMEQKIKDIIDEEVDGDYIQEKLKNKKGIIDLKGKIIEANRFSGDTVHANQNMDIGTGQDTSVATQGWVKRQGYSTGGSSSSDPATPAS